MWCIPYRPSVQYGKNNEIRNTKETLQRQPWTGATATKLPYLYRMQMKKREIDEKKEEKRKPNIKIEREFPKKEKQSIAKRQCAEFTLKSQLPLSVCIQSQGISFPPLAEKYDGKKKDGVGDKDFMRKTFDPKLSFCREVLFDRGIVPYNPLDKFGFYFKDREFKKRTTFQRNKNYYKPGHTASHQLCISSANQIKTNERVRKGWNTRPDIEKFVAKLPESSEVEQLVQPESSPISSWEVNALRMVSERTAQWIANCCSGERRSEILQCIDLDKEPPSAVKKLLDIDDDVLDEIIHPKESLPNIVEKCV